MSRVLSEVSVNFGLIKKATARVALKSHSTPLRAETLFDWVLIDEVRSFPEIL
jgi:hypothetical protein